MDFVTQDITQTVPSVLLYAKPGWGKTVAIAESYPDAIWAVTSAGNLHSFASWCKFNWSTPQDPGRLPASALPRTPVRPVEGVENPDPANPEHWRGRSLEEGGMLVTELQTFGADGSQRMPMLAQLNKLIAEVIATNAACDAGGIPRLYYAVVFDELTEMTSVLKQQGPSGWDGIDKVKETVKDLCRRLKRVGIAPIFICHEGAPKVQTDPTLKMYGNILVPFGPNLPFATMRDEVCGMFDVVLRGVYRQAEAGKPQQRALITESSEETIAKIRAFGVAPVETRSVRAILHSAGYKVST